MKQNKNKTNDEMHTDMLNFHISKGNIPEERINIKHKSKINASNKAKFAKINKLKKASAKKNVS